MASGLTPQPVPLPEKNEKTHHTLFATLTQANPLQAGAYSGGAISTAPSLRAVKRHARHPITPIIFCRIQRFIDAGKQLFNRFAVMMFSHADADGHRQRLVFANRLADPPPVSARGRSANGAKKQKLFSTPAINFIFAVDRRFQNTREHQQDLIAFLMAVNIINALEMIDID